MFNVFHDLWSLKFGTWIFQLSLIPLAFLYSNLSEWIFHKYVLHGLGKNKKSFWSFHWNEHHRNARSNSFFDADYKRSIFHWNAQTKEAAGIFLAGLAYLPLFFFAPFAYLALVYCGVNYYHAHKKSHLDPQWAQEKLPWHYDHHMGANQDANWCVTKPWMDHLLGTRIKSLNIK
jgi:hypothetical protein